MSFVYPPLTGNQPIRLVRLEPALTLSQPIRCHLEQVYLDDCRGKKPTYTYEALSYTWGARIGTVAINCNDSSLLVTPNCESALRHLRHRTKDRVLWIDAICINQQSVEEKNNQVPLMGEIYRSAAAVIIWLGPGLQGEEGTLRWAHLAGWAIYIRTPPGEPLPTNKLIRMASGAISSSQVKKARRICDNPWFGRTWTMQEVLLAKKAYFQIGRAACPTWSLYSYRNLIDTTRPSLTSVDQSPFHMRIRALELRRSLGAEEQDLGGLSSRLGPALEPFGVRLEEYLTQVLMMASRTNATDLRDKSYGVIGLISDIMSLRRYKPPQVDYDRPVAEVLEDLTWSLIHFTKTLLPLELISRPEKDSPYDLPSWVVDLRNGEYVSSQWVPLLRREESHSREVILDTPRIPGKLPVRIRIIAEVSDVYNRMPIPATGQPGDDDKKRRDCYSQWSTVADQLDKSPDQGVSNFARYLEDLTPKLDGLRKRHGYESQRVREVKDNALVAGEPGETLYGNGLYDGTTLLLTACKRLGLSKGNVEKGDKLCQVVGARYPCLVQQLVAPGPKMGYREDGEYRFKGIADICGGGVNGQIAWEKDWFGRSRSTIYAYLV